MYISTSLDSDNLLAYTNEIEYDNTIGYHFKGISEQVEKNT